MWSVARSVFSGAPLDLFPSKAIFLAIVAVVFPLAAWLFGSVLIYLYLVLAGALMTRAEREWKE